MNRKWRINQVIPGSYLSSPPLYTKHKNFNFFVLRNSRRRGFPRLNFFARFAWPLRINYASNHACRIPLRFGLNGRAQTLYSKGSELESLPGAGFFSLKSLLYIRLYYWNFDSKHYLIGSFGFTGTILVTEPLYHSSVSSLVQGSKWWIILPADTVPNLRRFRCKYSCSNVTAREDSILAPRVWFSHFFAQVRLKKLVKTQESITKRRLMSLGTNTRCKIGCFGIAIFFFRSKIQQASSGTSDARHLSVLS